MNTTLVETKDPSTTLRLALAMRGGVSLAVWIGGVVAEIDLFRRACSGELCTSDDRYREARAKTYQRLLAATRYDRVEIDILAGASAGGLNAVLYGLALSTRAVTDETVRDIWIHRGGIWELLRDHRAVPPEVDGEFTPRWPRDRRVPSLLQGDERLLDIARKALGVLAGERPSDGPPQQFYPANKMPPDEAKAKLQADSAPTPTISVELSATMLDDPFSPATANRTGFSFRKTPANLDSGFSTIPGHADAASATKSDALDRMALAARATSSFPGAFEPARIFSREPPEAANSPLDMSPVFPQARKTGAGNEDKPFRVVDGGIFDNIPIDRAIRAIERTSAAAFAERRLVYIDPEPPAAVSPLTTADRGSATGWLAVIRSSLALQQRTETAADELALIRQHNGAVLRNRGRLEALAAAIRAATSAEGNEPIAPPPWLDVTETAYRQCRIAQDANRIAALLTDPWSELRQPPHAARYYAAVSPTAALGIKDQVSDAYNAEPGLVSSTDVYAMLDAVGLLIAWTDELQRLPTAKPLATTRSAELAGLRRRAQRYRIVLTEAKHRAVDATLAEPLRNSASDPNGFELRPQLRKSRVAQAYLTVSVELAQFLSGAGQPDTDERFYALLATGLGTSSNDEVFLTTIGAGLQALRDDICSASPAVPASAEKPPLGETHDQRRWRESVFSQFPRPDVVKVSLPDLTKLFALTGIPGTGSIVEYHEITADAEPRIRIPVLRTAAQAKYLIGWAKKRPPAEEVDRVVNDRRALDGADAKLAGNVLSRFGGFLSARWRENDWQWGRLDAAAGIVKLLEDARTPSDDPPDIGADDIANLQCLILQESMATTTSADPVAIAQTAGADTLDAISPHYRFALASRIVPLVYRALLPERKDASFVDHLRRAVLIAVRPLCVPLPLIADPLRLALALVVVLGSAALLGTHHLTPGWSIVVGCLLVVLGGVGGWRANHARAGWATVGALLDDEATASPEKTRSWRTLRNEAYPRRWIIASHPAAVMSAIAGVCLVVRRDCGLPVEAVLLVVAAVAGAQQWLNSRCYRMSTGAPGSRGVSGLRGPLGVVSLTVAMGALAVIRPEGRLIEAAIAGATVLGLTLISLLGWAEVKWALVIPLGFGVVAAVVQCKVGQYWTVAPALLPTMVWLLLVGATVQYVPAMSSQMSGQNTPWGERDRPVMALSPVHPTG